MPKILQTPRIRVVAMVGPHAVGKTTAADRWKQSNASLTVINCDNDSPVANPKGVTLLEGCSAHANQWLDKLAVNQVIHCYCSPNVLASNMRLRCSKSNKKYREDYWTYNKLVYESRGRGANLIERLGLPVREFCIDTYETWGEVDKYFYNLCKQLLV